MRTARTIFLLCSVKLELRNHIFELNGLAAMYWPVLETLIVSDVHLGKATHFRKMGYHIPSQVGSLNIANLELLFRTYQPKQVVFLGDLFHSDYNSEWDVFGHFLKQHSHIAFVLIEGNHDILDPSKYEEFKIELKPHWIEEGFAFTHIPIENNPTDYYNIAGHIHPGIKLRGQAKQRAILPCFWLGEQQGILPAFGDLTGLHPIQPKKNDQVIGLAEGQLVKLSGV